MDLKITILKLSSRELDKIDVIHSIQALMLHAAVKSKLAFMQTIAEITLYILQKLIT